MLEAMTMGAFPIQSDTELTAEWITHEINGLLVNPADPADIERALRKALEEDALVNEAAEINLQMVYQKLDAAVVKPKVVEMYKTIVAQSKGEI